MRVRAVDWRICTRAAYGAHMQPGNLSLSFDEPAHGIRSVMLGPQAVVLQEFAASHGPALLAAIEDISHVAPFRHLVTPGGWTMSVAMTNCGETGWVSDRSGYRYDAIDPLTGRAWPAMPSLFHELAAGAAAAAGFAAFEPQACLVNRYQPGARLSLHQDRDEGDLAAPIVSVSLGVPATFLWGGKTRSERPHRILVSHGDVAVWGGVDRLAFHGVQPLAEGMHPLTGNLRYNLTFRKAR
jgi:alkylated DNA repair protein (DNA oxidative demethylase)